jgi:5-methylcytosine-specific restriction endonuclease McrA
VRPARPETVTAAVKREVWQRAGGKCEWKLPSGEACSSTVRLELDHVTPRALGGPSTIDNLRLTCRSPEISPRFALESRGRSIE